ncbi:hypothetical protein CHM34_18070 [Paludifilum halophilum]|uniref:Uncharacterized protein n=1 Tax=Paludifilum halophilum TaxID=1642702 RepID=A0A235B2H9_9BACL|nr:hypothetical protein CHM34_18070 [Paludifilum halophilum]
MWFRLKYRDTVGKRVGYLCWAQDPEMLMNSLHRHRIITENVDQLWIDEGNGFEHWRPELLKRVQIKKEWAE